MLNLASKELNLWCTQARQQKIRWKINIKCSAWFLRFMLQHQRRMQQSWCGMSQILCGLSHHPCGLLHSPCALSHLSFGLLQGVGYHILCEGCCSIHVAVADAMWDITGTVWAFSVSVWAAAVIVHDKTSSMWDIVASRLLHDPRRPLQTPYRLLKPLR